MENIFIWYLRGQSVFQDGDQISVIKHYNKTKINTIRWDINLLNSISSTNIYDIEEKLLDFYNRLGTNIGGN